MVTLNDLTHGLKSYSHRAQNNKQHHSKELLTSYHMNGHTEGFRRQTQKIESPC